MSWEDRLKPPSIITPDSEEYIFEYEDVSLTQENETSRHRFSNLPGALVQNFGVGLTNLPLTIFFTGEDYDKIADAFLVSVGLPGNCTLEHPMYGIRTVVVERVSRSDRLKTGANQAAITLTISETIIEEGFTSVEQEADTAETEAEETALVNDGAGYDASFLENLQNAIARVLATMDKYKKIFGDIMDQAAEIKAQFDSIVAAIENGVALLLSVPGQLFAAITRLMELPARVKARIQDKIAAFKEAFDFFEDMPIQGLTQDAKNQRIEAQANIAAITNGLALSYIYAAKNSAGAAQIQAGVATVTEGVVPITDAVVSIIDSGIGFVTRIEAVQAAVGIIATLQTGQEYLDIEQQTSEDSTLAARYTVPPSLTQHLSSVIKKTAGSLIALSFQLRQERIIELSRPVTFVEFCWQFYGTTTNNTLDFFIATNKLADEELIMVPKNRLIRYYV